MRRLFPQSQTETLGKIMRHFSSYCFYSAKWHPSVMTWSISLRLHLPLIIFVRGVGVMPRAGILGVPRRSLRV